jgi:hypothetical protein
MELFEEIPINRELFARLIAQTPYDPLPFREIGAEFDFKDHPKWRVFPGDDFTYVNSEIPLPNADCNLGQCFEEFVKDVEQCNYALKLSRKDPKRRDLSIADLCRIARVHWDWARFLAYRHPDPDERRRYLEFADRIDGTMRMVNRMLMDEVNSRREAEAEGVRR